MLPKERVYRRLAGEPVDKVPNLNIVMAFAAKFIDVPYSKFATDYKYLVEGNMKICEYFGIDMLNTMSDAFRETYDFGAEIIFPEDNIPVCTNHLIKEYSDIEKLQIRQPRNGKRMNDRIKAVELYKSLAGTHYPILGWVEGAFAEANDLRNMSDLMMDLYEEPEFARELLEICNRQAIEFALEQIKAGADFIGVGDAAASLVGPDNYEKFVLPYEIELFDAIHNAGAKVKLHICGDINNILHLIAHSGADIVDIDWMVDMKAAVDIFKDKASVNGNFDPVDILLRGTVNKVNDSVKRCLNLGDETTFISAGCEVPRETPYENLLEVNKALLEA